MVWKPGDLPIVGEWRPDGPALPVEFSRQSRDGRMTLVVTDGAKPLPVSPLVWFSISSAASDRARIVVDLRLFSATETPSYHVVVGEIDLTDSAHKQALDQHMRMGRLEALA